MPTKFAPSLIVREQLKKALQEAGISQESYIFKVIVEEAPLLGPIQNGEEIHSGKELLSFTITEVLTPLMVVELIVPHEPDESRSNLTKAYLSAQKLSIAFLNPDDREEYTQQIEETWNKIIAYAFTRIIASFLARLTMHTVNLLFSLSFGHRLGPAIGRPGLGTLGSNYPFGSTFGRRRPLTGSSSSTFGMYHMYTQNSETTEGNPADTEGKPKQGDEQQYPEI